MLKCLEDIICVPDLRPCTGVLLLLHTHTHRRYRDAHLKSEFHDMSLRNDAAVFEEEEEGDASLVMANRLVSDSEEEIDTGEVRQ